MNRRDFLKNGTAGLTLASSHDALSLSTVAGDGRGRAHSTSPVDALAPHERESGLVTKAEMGRMQRWFEAITSTRDAETTPEPWMDQWLSAHLPFSFNYGGTDSNGLLPHWELTKTGKGSDPDFQRNDFTWADASTGLRVTWETRRFANFPAIEWLLSFENRGDKDTPILQNIQDLDLKMKLISDQPYLVHGAYGGRYKRDDWWPFARYVPSTISGPADYEDGKRIELGGTYPSSRHDLPFANIEAPDGRGIIIGVGWTGAWSGHLAVADKELRAHFGLKETHFTLHPGERIRTARILLQFWEGKRLHGQNMLRQLLHRHYVPELKGELQKPLVSVNSCFTYHADGDLLTRANAKNLAPLVKPFTDLGAEIFIVDAGWYPGSSWEQWMGNWNYSRERYPQGFTPLSTPLKAAGVDFGIWFAPEVVCKNVPLFKEHPEWLTSGPTVYGGFNLRLELPEARAWFLNQVDDLIANQGMTCYRQDGYNTYDNVHAGEPDDRKGMAEIQYTTGHYTLLDAMRQKHPNLIMEAAAGAARIDLETLARFHWHQPCETWLHEEWDQWTVCGISQWLPGGLIVFYNGATDDYAAWSRFGGQLCLAWDPLDPKFPMQQAHRQVELYKRIRAYLSGDFYPLTPISLEQGWLGYQFHRQDLDRGVAMVFRRSQAPTPIYSVSDTFRLQLRGLQPQAHYRVHFEGAKKDQKLTGQALAKGIDLVLDRMPSAEMIVYELAG